MTKLEQIEAKFDELDRLLSECRRHLDAAHEILHRPIRVYPGCGLAESTTLRWLMGDRESAAGANPR